MVRGSSLLLRRATAIRIDLAQLGFPYHTIYAGLGLNLNLHISTLTWIPLYRNRSSATREHSTHFTASFVLNGFIGACYTVLSPSLHSQCAVVVFHKGVAEIYWAYQSMWPVLAKPQPHTSLQRTVLNRWRRGHYIKS
jgi:hypothetical protein